MTTRSCRFLVLGAATLLWLGACGSDGGDEESDPPVVDADSLAPATAESVRAGAPALEEYVTCSPGEELDYDLGHESEVLFLWAAEPWSSITPGISLSAELTEVPRPESSAPRLRKLQLSEELSATMPLRPDFLFARDGLIELLDRELAAGNTIWLQHGQAGGASPLAITTPDGHIHFTYDCRPDYGLEVLEIIASVASAAEGVEVSALEVFHRNIAGETDYFSKLFGDEEERRRSPPLSWADRAPEARQVLPGAAPADVIDGLTQLRASVSFPAEWNGIEGGVCFFQPTLGIGPCIESGGGSQGPAVVMVYVDPELPLELRLIDHEFDARTLSGPVYLVPDVLSEAATLRIRGLGGSADALRRAQAENRLPEVPLFEPAASS